MIERPIPGTAWHVCIEPWQDGYLWRVTNNETGYRYSSSVYDSPPQAEIAALWHIVQHQSKAATA